MCACMCVQAEGAEFPSARRVSLFEDAVVTAERRYSAAVAKAADAARERKEEAQRVKVCTPSARVCVRVLCVHVRDKNSSVCACARD